MSPEGEINLKTAREIDNRGYHRKCAASGEQHEVVWAARGNRGNYEILKRIHDVVVTNDSVSCDQRGILWELRIVHLNAISSSITDEKSGVQ